MTRRNPWHSAFTGAICAVMMMLPIASSWADTALDVSPAKRTSLGLYMTAADANKAVTADADNVLFLDVRTPAEVMFVGAPLSTDANVPFVDLASPATWDAKNGRFLLVPNKSFVAQTEARLRAKQLDTSDRVIVMCRSGDRSAKAVDALAGAGFKNVWTVIDGFEGDLSKEGRRDVNGWKNAGLPWTYKLDKAKLDVGSEPVQ